MGFYTQLIYITTLHTLIVVILSTHGAQIPTSYAIVKNSQNALCSALMRLVLQRKGSKSQDHFTDYESIPTSTKTSVEPTVKIKCLSGSMLITIKDPPTNHETGLFSGMIYPRGLSKNSTCLTEYRDHDSPLRYKLPLRSCNTMPQETIYWNDKKDQCIVDTYHPRSPAAGNQ
ncbi:hypothetical protein GQX74_013991 [Glossina fuscipes]|nr:hypothetical protein GQX74_013991 [Glossina fuscipes]